MKKMKELKVTKDIKTSLSTNIIDASIVNELRKSYRDYAISVIISRAVPDVRDGLKPVHRRILYAMEEGGFTSDKPYRKSARIVGDVMGKYHPHGDSAIYDSMVRMAQKFSMRLPIIDGQGNFGSMDGDKAAAMRYTESRLTKPANLLLQDLNKNTVDFRPNYDETLIEPSVLPSKIPNILINGTEGIAVGISTLISPHNPTEVIDATLETLKNPNVSLEQIMKILPGPDYPTGGILYNAENLVDIYKTGKGKITLRAKHHIEEGSKGKKSIVFTEMPYQVNKALLAEKISTLVKKNEKNEKIIDGISALRDESDKDGVRFVLETTPGANINHILQQLFTLTDLQINISMQMNLLHNGLPVLMNLQDILKAFIDFRMQIVRRRTVFDLRKTQERAHLVLGRLIALTMLDKVIATIRSSKDSQEALGKLMALKFSRSKIGEILDLLEKNVKTKKTTTVQLTEEQAKSILELKLHRLTGLEKEKLEQEAKDLSAKIDEFLNILQNTEARKKVIEDELKFAKSIIQDERRTEISTKKIEAPKDMPISHTEIDTTPTLVYLTEDLKITRNDDFTKVKKSKNNQKVIQKLILPKGSDLILIANSGRGFTIPVHLIPEKPANMSAIVEASNREKLVGMIPTHQPEKHVMFTTISGMMRRNKISELYQAAMNSNPLHPASEPLVSALKVDEDEHILLTSKNAMSLRMPVSTIRVFAGLGSEGVKGMSFKDNDEIADVYTLPDPQTDINKMLDFAQGKKIDKKNTEKLEKTQNYIITITDTGCLKKTTSHAFRPSGRGGIGVATKSKTKKAGNPFKIINMEDKKTLVIQKESGKIITFDLDKIPEANRDATGEQIIPETEKDPIAKAWALEDITNIKSAP